MTISSRDYLCYYSVFFNRQTLNYFSSYVCIPDILVAKPALLHIMGCTPKYRGYGEQLYA